MVETEQEIAKTAVRQSNFFMMFAANISVVLCILFTSDILRHDIRVRFPRSPLRFSLALSSSSQYLCYSGSLSHI